jgi:cytochrome c-type biogenesis protein CcmF
LTFLPIVIPLLLLVPFGQTLAWKRGDMLGTAQRLLVALGLAIAAMLGLLAATAGGPVAAPLGIGLGLYLVVGGFNEVVTRAWRRGAGTALTVRKAAGLPRSTWGTVLAHAGVGVTVIGIAASAWSVEAIGTVSVGERIAVGPYEARLDRVVPRTGPNYREDAATVTVMRNGREAGTVETMKRIYLTRGMPTTEAGILTSGVSQVYASFGDAQPDGSIGLRLYYKPLVLLIWIGAVIMALGGAVSLTDRRFRIGAPVRGKAMQAMPAPAE